MNTCKKINKYAKGVFDAILMAIIDTDMQYIEHKIFGVVLTVSPLLIAALRPCAKVNP